MENQLIVYVPKKNVKKIVLTIFLGLILSLIIFLVAAYSSASISMKSKWNETSNNMIDSFYF